MKELIDKAAVVAEIERIMDAENESINSFERHRNTSEKQRYNARMALLAHILSFLNTLEVKEVDLEEKATQLSLKYFPDEENIWARANIEAYKCKSACIEMVEWLKAQKGE